MKYEEEEWKGITCEKNDWGRGMRKWGDSEQKEKEKKICGESWGAWDGRLGQFPRKQNYFFD